MKKLKFGLPLLIVIALVVLVLDQLAKWWIVENVARKGTATLIEGFVRLRYTENRGAAFGFLQGWGGALSIAAVAIVIGILYSASKLGHGNRTGLIALGMITGGALGNLIDRLRLGYVIDFVDLYGPRIEINNYPYTFPVFNVADSAITVGAIVLIASFIFSRDGSETPEHQTSDDQSDGGAIGGNGEESPSDNVTAPIKETTAVRSALVSIPFMRCLLPSLLRERY